MAIHITNLNGGNITIGAGGGSSEPTAPNGKVLYKTSADGEWIESVANISDGTFIGFNEKNSAVAVIIPSKDASGNNVTIIEEGAFQNCNGLTSVTIPNGVESIWGWAFYNCSGLTSVTIGNDVTTIGECAFQNTGLTSVTIPNNVANINGWAFANCSSLTSVTIPDSVTDIGDDAFSGCTSLSSVTIVANGENANYVKENMIIAGVPSNITWNMPS